MSTDTPAADIEPLLTVEEVAGIYRVSKRTVEGWTRDGKGPAPTQTPSGKRYAPADVRADLAARRAKAGAAA